MSGSTGIANHHSGTVVGNGFSIQSVDVSSLDPESFFTTYILKRCPVVINGFSEDIKGIQAWTNSYLRDKAGKSKVEVEKRHSPSDSFGKGNNVNMLFEEFIEKLESKNEQYYLTTQKIEIKETGRPDILSQPLKDLFKLGDFPIRPRLFGNLIPMNLNVWMGNTKQGSSSGLHHDYHDNLYVLLRGKKRFRLFSPSDAHLMFTVGKIDKVHENGRINYEGFPTSADGSEEGSLTALLLSNEKQIAEKRLAEAEEAAANGIPGASKLVEEAERKLDEVLDKLLDQGDDFDDFDDMAEESEMANSDENDSVDQSSKRRRTEECKEDPTQIPLNFSSVDDLDAPSEKYAKFLRAQSVFVDLKANQMLYLPAGWFHEVTSINDATSKEPGHFAFNYWMHPPDGTSFKRPYKSEFWEKDWVMTGYSKAE